MEDLIEAIKSNDLVAVRKAAAPLIESRVTALIEARKAEIARSVMIEGEEADEDDEDDEKSDKADKKDKKESDDADDDEDDE
ncbi:prohead core protein [Escherichia phage vB_EcoM-E33]|uniref:Prohead core protein n=5 Tax=Dhakavirus TaxID=1914165 RepID=A0A172Q2E0_9CAUD|nr:prohead [Escherichia phage Bp7]YP_009202904.1 prohead [Escherichia phage QL01]YP_009323372.1 prohead [Escherichia phage WG01]YP_009324066.1 prohead [Escherichia phage MX01]YP_010094247.1 prohead [Enterobacteria phage vB_EcoM_IME281]QJA42706.1 prohead core protein precursor [Enterobacteria phage vB_EcoM_IME540]QLF81491.1 prohead core protein [Escherichia phage vB_EcoM_FB]QXV72528.1 prehead core component [Shigella phage PSD9]UKH49101.1 prohead core protein [Escherichia phage vB_EcoM-E33]